VLDTEWDADDGQAAGDTESEVKQCYLDATQKYPQNIHKDTQAPIVILTGSDFTPEGPECKSCHLQKLEPERDTYDGAAEKQPHDSIVDRYYKSAEQKPDFILHKTDLP